MARDVLLHGQGRLDTNCIGVALELSKAVLARVDGSHTSLRSVIQADPRVSGVRHRVVEVGPEDIGRRHGEREDNRA